MLSTCGLVRPEVVLPVLDLGFFGFLIFLRGSSWFGSFILTCDFSVAGAFLPSHFFARLDPSLLPLGLGRVEPSVPVPDFQSIDATPPPRSFS